jgi:hypothetical protein
MFVTKVLKHIKGGLKEILATLRLSLNHFHEAHWG